MRLLCITYCLLFCIHFCLGKPSQLEKGGGKDYHGEEYSSQGEKGDKGYEFKYGEDKGSKGHHNKENHSGHYKELVGSKKGQHHDDGYYASRMGAEKLSKGARFEEHGRYAKGHSTKGSHVVHKLDEYKKKTDFYSEDHNEGYKEDYGDYEEKKGIAKAGHEAGGHYKKEFLEKDFGKKGDFENGSHFDENKGHKEAIGYDSYYENADKYGHEGLKEQFKKWKYADH